MVAAIKNEAAPETGAARAKWHWIDIGQLGKLIEILQREGIREVMMTGQVKHVSLFSGLTPDWRLLKVLASLRIKTRPHSIGGIQNALREEGIELVDSTRLLKPLLAKKGCLRAASRTKKSWPTCAMAANSHPRWRPRISARALPSAIRPVWRLRRWRAPMPCCAGRLRW